MKKNKIIEHENGYEIVPNANSIDKGRDHLRKELLKLKMSIADVVMLLSIMSVEEAYKARLNKPQYLSRLSMWWEEMARADEEENEVK